MFKKIANFTLLLLFISPAFAFAGAVQLPQTGQTTCYDTSGAVIDCAGPGKGQDGDLRIGVAWPEPRFNDIGNGTVIDNLTGLIWLKNANCFDSQTWANAISSANSLRAGACGLTDNSMAGDWRLPNRKELRSLVDYSRYGPALPGGQPFTNVLVGWYWSSSTCVGNGNAWVVDMWDGSAGSYDQSHFTWVWPVRGGIWQ